MKTHSLKKKKNHLLQTRDFRKGTEELDPSPKYLISFPSFFLWKPTNRCKWGVTLSCDDTSSLISRLPTSPHCSEETCGSPCEDSALAETPLLGKPENVKEADVREGKGTHRNTRVLSKWGEEGTAGEGKAGEAPGGPTPW